MSKNVHTEHCCDIHGCKYGEINCPVATGIQKPSYLCEQCDEDEKMRLKQIWVVEYGDIYEGAFGSSYFISRESAVKEFNGLYDEFLHSEGKIEIINEEQEAVSRAGSDYVSMYNAEVKP